MANKQTVISVENMSKQYRLGDVGTGTLAHDLNRWWFRVRGRDDPYRKVTEANDLTESGAADYVWALENINFQVQRGDVLGIIGRNGAGKSTLLKILSRVTGPTIGKVKMKGRIGSLLEVGTGFHPELTGRENVYLNGAILGMTRREVASKLDDIVGFSGCTRYVDTPVKRYSSGMMVRLGFAVAAYLEPEILIVDEVLAVGDAEFQKKCIRKMKDVAKNGRTILFVSHNMTSVRNLCTKGLLLRAGTVQLTASVEECLDRYLSDDANHERKRKENYFGDRICRLDSVLLQDESGKDRSDYQTGESTTLNLEIEAFEDSPNTAFHIGIYREDEVLAAFVNSERNHFSIDLESGRRTVRCRLSNVSFSPGRYMIYVTIISKGIAIYSLANAAALQIHSNGRYEEGRRPYLMLDDEWQDT